MSVINISYCTNNVRHTYFVLHKQCPSYIFRTAQTMSVIHISYCTNNVSHTYFVLHKQCPS